MNRLDGKVAIVTGGARGQGEAEVRLFVAEGGRVVFGDVLDDLGEIVAKDLGDAAIYLHHDVRSEDDWAQVVDEAESRFGKVDVLVNNAGVLDFGRSRTRRRSTTTCASSRSTRSARSSG